MAAIDYPKSFVQILFLLFAVSVNAQKLPNVQKVSVHAPADVKIDGKATEWNDTYQAYNNATELYYTIANDDKNLYLSIKITNPDIVNKFFIGGITWEVKKATAKDDAGNISLTYPIVPRGTYLVFRLASKEDTSARQLDSMMYRNNNKLIDKCKLILVKSIKKTDTISVYNNEDIGASGLFNRKKAYILELQLPLKQIDTDVKSLSALAYHIIINGTKTGTPAHAVALPNSDQKMLKQIEDMNTFFVALQAPTDFWGQYTLAK